MDVDVTFYPVRFEVHGLEEIREIKQWIRDNAPDVLVSRKVDPQLYSLQPLLDRSEFKKWDMCDKVKVTLVFKNPQLATMFKLRWG